MRRRKRCSILLAAVICILSFYISWHRLRALLDRDSWQGWTMKDKLDYEFPERAKYQSLMVTTTTNNQRSWEKPPRVLAVDCNNTDGAVVLVKSRVYAFHKRMQLRSYLRSIGYNDSIVFFIGMASDESRNAADEHKLQKEFSMHHDMVIGDYEDTYHTLRFKELYRASYYLYYCDAKAAIFLDDDVRPKLTEKVLSTISNSQPGLKCLMEVHRNARVFRDPANDWYTSRFEYFGDYFPDYCAGPCFAFNKETANQLITQARERDFKSTGTKSDVYLTGIFRILADLTIDNSLTNVCNTRSHKDHAHPNFAGSRRRSE